MELKELLKKDENELFNEYLSIPTLSHAKDQCRFVRYALVANANGSGFNHERELELRNRGLDDRQIERLRMIYSWMGRVLDVLE